jgi:hypothetical protein
MSRGFPCRAIPGFSVGVIHTASIVLVFARQINRALRLYSDIPVFQIMGLIHMAGLDSVTS